MPIATPEAYAEMLDKAKPESFAFPAINVSSSQTLNAALAGLRRGRERRHHPGLDRRRGVPLRPDGQEHGGRLGRVRGVRRRGGEELPGQHRAAHRPLPQGQARRVRPPAARRSRSSGSKGGPGPAVPVAHVGRLRRTAGGEPADRRRSCSPRRAEAKIVLEIEVGVVGGEEDGVEGGSGDKLYSTTEDALATVEALGTGEKGRYLTALTFGNVHGVYKPGNVKLRPEILQQAQEAVVGELGLDAGAKPFDLVFHGGSGSTAEEIGAAVDYGVVKMNVDTDTQYAFTRPVGGAHVHQLRRRAQGRRRGRQQEGLRPPRLGQGRRGRHGRAGRRGVREPPQHRHSVG